MIAMKVRPATKDPPGVLEDRPDNPLSKAINGSSDDDLPWRHVPASSFLLTDQQRLDLIAVLERSIQEKPNVSLDTVNLKLVSSKPDKETLLQDDCEELKAWLAANCDVPEGLVCWADFTDQESVNKAREYYRNKASRSCVVRRIKNRATLNTPPEWKGSSEPTSGWEGRRVPSVNQLFTHAKFQCAAWTADAMERSALAFRRLSMIERRAKGIGLLPWQEKSRQAFLRMARLERRIKAANDSLEEKFDGPQPAVEVVGNREPPQPLSKLIPSFVSIQDVKQYWFWLLKHTKDQAPPDPNMRFSREVTWPEVDEDQRYQKWLWTYNRFNPPRKSLQDYFEEAYEPDEARYLTWLHDRKALNGHILSSQEKFDKAREVRVSYRKGEISQERLKQEYRKLGLLKTRVNFQLIGSPKTTYQHTFEKEREIVHDLYDCKTVEIASEVVSYGSLEDRLTQETLRRLEREQEIEVAAKAAASQVIQEFVPHFHFAVDQIVSNSIRRVSDNVTLVDPYSTRGFRKVGRILVPIKTSRSGVKAGRSL